ncbi:MAG: efflux RND transporter periplasmic adaptor subunit [Roseiflexaceae bacterium]|nr:efflux RND transporter periplasmic adaptor subunit [Roseiflexaceae bacterium]
MRLSTIASASITLAALALTLAACAPGASNATAAGQTTTIERGTIALSVSGNGEIRPARDLDMNFGTTGTVADLLVEEGQQVQQGDLLARLVTTDLDQQVVQAEANLKSAQAQLADLQDGPATTDVRDIAAQLASAQAQLGQQTNGNARPSEISSAQAQLDSARAALAALKNPTQAEISKSQLSVTQAENSLATTRTTSAKNKADTKLKLDQAANALRNAQDTLSSSYWDTHNGDGSLKKSSGDPGYQNDLDTYNKAVRDEQDAAASMTQAQIAYDEALAKEQVDLADAEATLADGEAQLAALQNPSAADLASAQAQVASAESSLKQLTGGTSSDIAVARSSVEQRQAALDALNAPASTADLASAEASVAQAQASLTQARLSRAEAELVAPFAGIVAEINIKPGAASSSASPAIYLIDNSAFHVDVQISESDLGQIEIGQPAAVELDALAAQPLSGTVSYIASSATDGQDITTYLTRVQLDDASQSLRAGLSASVDLTGATVRDVLVVPNSAIVETDNGPQVRVQREGNSAELIAITTGLVGDTFTEVTSGLNEGDVIVLGASSTGGGPFGG